MDKPILFWETQMKFGRMKNLAQLVLFIMEADCTNVNVERSMKTLAVDVAEKRNRLGLVKVNEEVCIRFNQNGMILSDERCDRINESYLKPRNLYLKTKLNIKDEIDCIKCIDSLKISKNGRKKKNGDQLNTTTSSNS